MKRVAFAGLCVGFVALFAALGIWQVERLHWKTALIERIDARRSASPRPPPPADQWSPDDAYTRVLLEGEFLHDRDTLVMAVTDLGPGWWVMTPLQWSNTHVLVNRGFVPQEKRSARDWSRPDGPQVVNGLLRTTEPNGAFLRANAPADERWYSRDVEAIAKARGIASVAPYFVDMEADPDSGPFPRGGLTVVSFSNNHLTYALTWFALAVIAAMGAVFALRRPPL